MTRAVRSVILLVALSGATCSRSTADQQSVRQPLTIRYVDLVNVDMRNVPLMMAFDELAAQGYAVQATHVADGALRTALLARGDADIGAIADDSVWAAVTKGADIRTIAQYTAPTTVLAARDSIRSCRDLDGKRLGLATSTSYSLRLFQSYFDRECGGAEPQRLVMTEAAARSAALVAGSLDASTLPSDDLIKLQRHSAIPIRMLMTYAEQFPGMQVDGLHVRYSWAKSHPEAVKDFLRAMLHAHREIQSDPRRLFDEAVKRLGLDAATAQAIGESHLKVGIWNGNGGLSREAVEATIDFMVRANALPARIAVDQVADLSYLDAVLQQIGRVPSPPIQSEH